MSSLPWMSQLSTGTTSTAEQRKESNGNHGLQMGREKQNLCDLAHPSISKEKYICYQRATLCPHISGLCMSAVL